MSKSSQYLLRSNPFRTGHGKHTRAPSGLRGFCSAVLCAGMLLMPSLIEARDFQVSILPFRISGQVPEQYFSPKSLPTEIQQATGFLFGLHKDYPLDSMERLNRALPPGTTAKGAMPGTDYCAYTRGTHILTGEASFSGTSSVRISMELKSCNTGRILDSGVAFGPLNDLQSLMVKAIRASSLTLPNRSLPGWPTTSEEWIIVLDQSGSMAGTKLEMARALRSLIVELQGKLSLGLLLVSENGNRMIPPSRNLKEVLSILEASANGGEVSLNQISRSFQELKKLPASDRRIIILTDASGQSSASFESSVRNLTASGWKPVLLNSPGLPMSSRQLFARLNRSLKLNQPDIYYGMRAGFVEGFSLLFVQKGDRFYISRRDISDALRTGRLTPDSLEPVATVNLRDENLTLPSVIRSYAKQKNLRLIGTGDLVSSLESGLESLMSASSGAPYRFLVKNQSTAFWIQCESRSVARELDRARQSGNTVYLGLQLRQGSLGLENNPSLIFIRSAADVPSLFIQRYHQLQSENLLKKQDIWFFLVEVVDSR